MAASAKKQVGISPAARAKPTDGDAKGKSSSARSGKPDPETVKSLGAEPLGAGEELKALTPLDIMLRAMREHFAAGRIEAAVAIAKEAAPYVHGKLSSSAQGAGSSLVRLEWIDPSGE